MAFTARAVVGPKAWYPDTGAPARKMGALTPGTLLAQEVDVLEHAPDHRQMAIRFRVPAMKHR